MTIPHIPIPAYLDTDLDLVEHMITERVRGRAIVAQIATAHTTRDAARRLRIALVLLSAQAGSYQFERTSHAATAIGLITTASSLHGGLVDPAARRSETVTAWPGMNANVPLMVGDYLFALAAAEMALAPDSRIIAYYSRSVMAFCEATLAPVRGPTAHEALAQYTEGVARSTATLIESACRAGAVCGGLIPDQIDALGRYGYALGHALAIFDDLQNLEYLLQTDIIPLPLIYAAEATGSQIPALIAQFHTNLIAEVRRTGGIERALQDAQQYLIEAQSHLNAIVDGPARNALLAVASYFTD